MIRVVVNRVFAGGGIFNAETVLLETAVQEVIPFPLRAAVFKTRPQRVIAAAVHFRFTAVLERAALRMDVHDASGAKAISRRQRTGDQLHGVHETRVELQAKPRDAFRQQHVVDAILQVGVLAAHMQITVHRRILRHARRTQDDLVKRRIGALRQGVYLFLAESMRRRAQVGNDLIPCLVQFANDGDITQLGDIR